MKRDDKSEPPNPSEEQMGQINALRARAKEYMHSARIISEPGASLTRLIARYAAGQSWDDPELRKQLSEAIRTARQEAALLSDEREGPGGDAPNFYQSASALLQDIQKQVLAGIL